MLFRGESPRLVVHAPAKLNLFLEIHGQRADGYHELETLMVAVGLYDSLSFTEDLEDERGSCRLEVRSSGGSRDESLPAGTDNLIVRAAALLRERAGVNRGVRITLWKRIPLAAGLAGGSSDAAATLAGLNRLWRLNLSREELRELAGELGSDVPFFLGESASAVCRGRGERVEPVRLPLGLHFVVVRPATGLSTAEVYRRCRSPESPRSVAPLVSALRAGRTSEAARQLHNRLQEPARELSEEVCELERVFECQPVLGHRLSGSGTAYFGLCPSRRAARRLGARLRARRLGRVFVVQSRP